MINKKLIYLIGTIFFIILAVVFALFYQSETKSLKIYTSALNDYSSGDYQNSYYQFSKVGYLSKFKPYAIYHQALCAKKLGDEKSELKQYLLLFNNYPKNKLSVPSKYFVAQKMLKSNPEQAKKYFEQIVESYSDTDYATASEYYLGLLLLNKYKNEAQFPLSIQNEIEKDFRHYLKQAPQGVHALNVITNWLSLDKEILKDDYLLMAQSYYLFEDYENAKKLLEKTDLSESWVLDVKNSYAMKNYARAKYIAEYGLKSHAQGLDEKDIREVTDIYIKLSDNKMSAIDNLYNISNPKDYVWSLKCDNSQNKIGCYKNLHLNYPKSPYGADALSKLFFDRILAKDYDNAQKIGYDYLNKYPDMPTTPMVTFWMGKTMENNFTQALNFYRKVISAYPDNFYAYKAFLEMKRLKSPLLNVKMKEFPVEYPYTIKDKTILKLIELKDFEILELLNDDDFVKSWLYYQKGEYSHSMLIARDAMEKLNPKPPKTDLRWRLVYPIHYYDLIKKYSANPVLMMALIREESYFNPNAQSSVGAKGLMQLMPSTAHEITGMDIDLFNPELNIKTGNAYYMRLRRNLVDVGAVAAYNSGLGAVGIWQNKLKFSDVDEFVEQIPYPETKNYVKKVFRTYWNYARIYSE